QPIHAHMLGRLADPGIEARIDAVRYAAGTGEERMPEAGKPPQHVCVNWLRHGANPGRCAIVVAENAITLNSEPIWFGPVPVRRGSAAAMSARWDAVALASSAAARTS